jgi:putative Mn2+ efflux pump MntP
LNTTLKLIALVLPMGLDTFGVALALGLGGLPARYRTRVALLFAAFETAMPLLGAGLGAPLGRTVGDAADYLAAGLLTAVGLYMLREQGEPKSPLSLSLSLARGGVRQALLLGLSVSMDELAIGFGAGLLRLPIVLLAIAVGVQAFVVTHLGLRVGRRVGARWEERSERVAGVALVALGAILLVDRLAA